MNKKNRFIAIVFILLSFTLLCGCTNKFKRSSDDETLKQLNNSGGTGTGDNSNYSGYYNGNSSGSSKHGNADNPSNNGSSNSGNNYSGYYGGSSGSGSASHGDYSGYYGGNSSNNYSGDKSNYSGYYGGSSSNNYTGDKSNYSGYYGGSSSNNYTGDNSNYSGYYGGSSSNNYTGDNSNYSGYYGSSPTPYDPNHDDYSNYYDNSYSATKVYYCDQGTLNVLNKKCEFTTTQLASYETRCPSGYNLEGTMCYKKEPTYSDYIMVCEGVSAAQSPTYIDLYCTNNKLPKNIKGCKTGTYDSSKDKCVTYSTSSAYPTESYTCPGNEWTLIGKTCQISYSEDAPYSYKCNDTDYYLSGDRCVKK